MTMLELLTIPGLDGSMKLCKLQMESQRRMRAGRIARRRAAAATNSRRSSSKMSDSAPNPAPNYPNSVQNRA